MKTLENHVLEGKSADNFYRKALKKRKRDMIDSDRNYLKHLRARGEQNCYARKGKTD